jgi:hypothetical protein
LAAVLAVSPTVAVAGGLADDPEPVTWPAVAAPNDSRGDASDPAPVAHPTVDQPDNSQDSSDPQPVDWPAPTEQ